MKNANCDSVHKKIISSISQKIRHSLVAKLHIYFHLMYPSLSSECFGMCTMVITGSRAKIQNHLYYSYVMTKPLPPPCF